MHSNFCYTWDFSPTKYHPDLKIYISDSKFGVHAHRAVLASHSYMLKTAFLSSDVDGEAVIILPDFTIEDVNQMIQLLYGQTSEVSNPSEIFSALGLRPDYQESEYFVDQDESELVLETMKSEITVDEKGCVKKPSRAKSKVFTDPGINLIRSDPLDAAGDSAQEVPVDAFIVNEPSNSRPWLCKLCLNVASKKPYRSVKKHNLKYHIIRKHFDMEVPKNWQCDLCAKEFISRSGLRQHKRDNCPGRGCLIEPGPFSADLNQESFPRRTPTPCEEPDSEDESKTVIKNQMFECANCSNIFENISDVKTHMQDCAGAVQEDEQVMYQCNECWEAGQEYICTSMEDLGKHIKMEHKDVEDILNAEVLVEENVGLDIDNTDVIVENTVEESILEEEVVENDYHMIVDDFNHHIEENINIDTTEVLIQSESAEVANENSNEITLVIVDENDNPVFCPVCNNGFSNPEVLAEHLSHHPSCPACSLRVLNTLLLREHMRIHPQCGVCGDRFSDINVLEKHEKNHADIDQAISGNSNSFGSKYQNPEIRDAISSIQSAPVLIKDDFIDGRKSAEQIQEANPDFSIDSLDDVQELDTSLSSLLAQQNIQVKCDICEKMFSNEVMLDLHIQGAHVQNKESPKFQLEILENLINCNFCQESFNSMSDLNTHTAAVHREILEAIQLVTPDQDVNSHEQVAVRENVPTVTTFNCTLCKEAFSKVGHLTSHIKINHKISKLESGKPFLCLICNSNFLQLSTLDKHHLVQHHGQEVTLDCPECGKTFKQTSSLQMHLRTHSSVKLYQCGSCNRTFNWDTSLRTHIKKCEGVPVEETVSAVRSKVVKPEVNIELGVGVHSLTVKCSRCGERFSDQGQFSEHTCPGNRGRGRRFRCGGCQMLFRSRKMVRRHLRSCESLALNKEDQVTEVLGHRVSKRARRVVKDDQFVSDIEGSDKELQDLVDSDAEEEFKVNVKEDFSESSDDSEGSSGDEQDDFTIEPNIKSYKVEKPVPPNAMKAHICTYCERAFKSSSHLKEHVMSHTGIFPHNCKTCGKGFRRSQALEKHKCLTGTRKRHVSVIQKTPVENATRTASPASLNKRSKLVVCLICKMSCDTQHLYSAHLKTSPICKDLTDKLNAGCDISDQLNEMDDDEDSNTGLYSCHVCEYRTDSGFKFNHHLKSEPHINRSKQVEEFDTSQDKFKCELCFFTTSSPYHYKRHNETKKHIDKKEAMIEEETMEKLKNPKIYTCFVCEKQFRDLISLDEHVEVHHKPGEHGEEDSEPELTSRSGRKIKAKKFHDDSFSGGLKRKVGEDMKEVKLCKMPKTIEGRESRQDSCHGWVKCGICGDTFSSHKVHFTHMISHVPPQIVKTLSLEEEGKVGWCPHCPGPVQLDGVEEHMLELHQDLEEDETELELKIGEKKLEFDEIDPDELEALELPDSKRCVPKRVPG